MSGEYSAVVSVATVVNLEVPGAPVKGGTGSCRISRVLAVVKPLVELI